MSSIFSRIFSYRRSKHRTPSEDYFTETFVAVLKRCGPLRTAFVEELLGMDRENIDAIRLETQKSFKVGRDCTRRRPDVWVEARDVADRRHVAIIENKIDSKEGENQLSDYAEILEGERGAKSRTLVYVTKYSEETNFRRRENLRFKHLKWFEVYGTLTKELQKSTEGIGDLPGELLKLMEDWNMDGTLSAAHLRAAVTCFDAGVGQKLHAIQDDAWSASRIGEVLDRERMPGNWKYGYAKGTQTSPPIIPYGVRLKMAFRFDRRDEGWDVDHLELPCPVVTLRPNGEQHQELPQRPENWTGAVEGMWQKNLWVRQPTQDQIPHYGYSLHDYYKDFFHIALSELREALEGDQ